MTDWRHQGQGMRRRMGAPSSYLDAANAGEHWHEPSFREPEAEPGEYADESYLNEPDERGYFEFEYAPRGANQHPVCPTCNRPVKGRS